MQSLRKILYCPFSGSKPRTSPYVQLTSELLPLQLAKILQTSRSVCTVINKAVCNSVHHLAGPWQSVLLKLQAETIPQTQLALTMYTQGSALFHVASGVLRPLHHLLCHHQVRHLPPHSLCHSIIIKFSIQHTIHHVTTIFNNPSTMPSILQRTSTHYAIHPLSHSSTLPPASSSVY